jgi:hypothetical protein
MAEALDSILASLEAEGIQEIAIWQTPARNILRDHFALFLPEIAEVIVRRKWRIDHSVTPPRINYHGG